MTLSQTALSTIIEGIHAMTDEQGLGVPPIGEGGGL